MKQRIRVPSKPSLIRMLLRCERDYHVMFTEEVAEWCARYAEFYARAARGGTPEAVWLQSCRDKIRKLEEAYFTIDEMMGYLTLKRDR